MATTFKREGKHAEARDLLAPVYSWFTEGFDTANLKDARALLDEQYVRRA
jgi:predicted ATPase